MPKKVEAKGTDPLVIRGMIITTVKCSNQIDVAQKVQMRPFVPQRASRVFRS